MLLGWGLSSAVHWFDGRFGDAIPAVTRAIEPDPDSILLRWLWGYTLALNGRVDEAAQQATGLVRTDEDFPYTRQLASLVHALQGNPKEALDVLAPLEHIELDAHMALHVAESYAAAEDDAHALDLLHHAIAKGAHLGGYFAWSLIDNWEWAHGYSATFGLARVDRATLARSPKGFV